MRVSVTVSPKRFQRLTFAAIWSLAAIMVTGAAVRLTGSGLGCPDWPTCGAGSMVPTADHDYHSWIEFINRLVTGLVGLAVALAVLGALWRVPKRWDLVWWALGLVAGTVAQVLLGRWVVTSHLTPWIVMAHFLLAIVMLWNAIVLHHRAKLSDTSTNPSPTDPGHATAPVPSTAPVSSTAPTAPAIAPANPTRTATPLVRWLMWLVGALAAWVVVSGTVVTGAGPHGGDEQAERLSFDISNVARIHAVSVLVLLALVLGLFWLLMRTADWPRYYQASYLLLGVILAQGFIGYVQYFNDVPELLVGMHIVGAISVWWAALNLHLTVLPPRQGRI